MSEFNLIVEPWIPVRFPDGRREELGIRDTLLRSKEIAVIEDPSPLVVASLHRLLLAVLYRTLEGPTDIDEAKHLFRDGIPEEKITRYLDRWQDRFWLFDDTCPFYQVADYEPIEGKNWKPWLELAAEHNAENAKVLWDHLSFTEPTSIMPAAAARWLVACQAFALGGGRSNFGNRRTAPSATARMAFAVGRDLHDTLVLSLVSQNRESSATDQAAWERVPPTSNDLKKTPRRAMKGWADLYTWQARAVKLKRQPNMMVKDIAFAQGEILTTEKYSDPMLSYVLHKKHGPTASQLHERGLWRDFDSLLPDSSDLAPAVIDNASRLTRNHIARRPMTVMVLGQASDQAKVKFWRMEQFVLPSNDNHELPLRGQIAQLLEDAQKGAHALEKSFKIVGRLSIAKSDRSLDLQEDKWVAGKWKPGDVSRFMGRTVGPEEGDAEVLFAYWSTLEQYFHEILCSFTTGGDPDVSRIVWLKAIREALKSAWDQNVSQGDVWAVRAKARAYGPLAREIRSLNQNIELLGDARESQ